MDVLTSGAPDLTFISREIYISACFYSIACLCYGFPIVHFTFGQSQCTECDAKHSHASETPRPIVSS